MNYPGPADAAWGVENGVVDQATAAAIVAAWSERKLTPQNTPLGSGIGFHGWASEWKGRGGARLSFGCVVHAQPRHRALVRPSVDGPSRDDGRDVLDVAAADG